MEDFPMEFLNRSNELSLLWQRLESGRAEFLVLYRRRRVGKTELRSRANGHYPVRRHRTHPGGLR